MKWLKKNVDWLLSVALMLMTVTVFGPLELYSTNATELWFGFEDVLKISGLLTLVFGVVLVLIGLLLRGKARRFYGAVLFALAAALYIQGNFANIHYGSLDGTEINWSSYTGYGIIDTLGWLAFLGAAVFLALKKPGIMQKIQKWGSIFLTAMLVISLTVILLTGGVLKQEKSDYYLSTEGMYEVSANENIIIFVLDAFDDAYFQDIYDDDHKKYNQVFEDFTYFDNAAVAAARTNAALPAILTGKPYPGKVPYLTYIEQSFNSDGLYSELHAQDFDTRIYTESEFVPDKAENWVQNQVSTGYKVTSYGELAKKYFDLILYKYMPHVLKQYFWMYTGDLDQFKTGTTATAYAFDDAAFFANMRLTLSNHKNAFRLFHLHGPHSPYTLNEFAQREESTDLAQQSKASLYIVENYIAQLKELGVYEDATIIVMADHGEANEAFGNSSAAHGILFVKPKGAESAFSISSAPVSYYDLHPTLFSALGKETGDTFFDIPLQDRVRMFYRYTMESAQFIVEEYTIQCNLNETHKVTATGNILRPDIEESFYQFGTQLTFGMNSNALPYIVSGISGTDAGDYTWMEGKESTFNFPLDRAPDSDLLVTLDLVSAYVPAGPQTVSVYANDLLCYTNEFTGGGMYTFQIPKAAFSGGQNLTLRFSLPDAVSPEQIKGPGNDVRELSLAIKGLKIEEDSSSTHLAASYTPNYPLTFGISGDIASYSLCGLYLDEPNFSWTSGSNTVFLMDLGGIPTSDLTVKLDVMSVYAENGSQTVRFLANGTLCHEETLSSGKTVTFTIPQSAVTNDCLSLQLELPNAISPYQLKGEGDQRVLALALKGLAIDYAGVTASTEGGFDLLALISTPLTALLQLCHKLLNNYTLAIIVFTLLTKVILLPVSLWVQKNGIAMVRLTPELNRLKLKYYGDKDTIAEQTQALYKKEKYNPLASTLPMIVQLVMLFGVIGAVKSALGGAGTLLTSQPSQIGGAAWLMPLAAGAAALALGLAQNKLNPLQREQSKKEQWMSNGFSIAISLSLGAFVSLGVCIYWIASNLFSIVQQLVLNLIMNPAKYVDYEALEQSRRELASIEKLSAGVSREDKKREKEDYKKFFSVANKHLVFYSEKSGFYKYFRDVMDFMLENSNVIIHYVTNDPKDQIFSIAQSQPRIRPYYIGENKLITLLMKMDAEIVVMTCPDLENFHLKRSYIRKDIEYIYMFHYPLSTHMVLNTGALDHYDTVFCVGDFQFDEIRAAETLYNTPEKKLVSAGYGQLEQLHRSFLAMEKVQRQRPKILIAPSWQPDNILDSCIDAILDQLLDKGYEVVVRPHPEYVKRYKARMDAIVQRYEGRENSGLVFELDFTSNDSLFNSDILISDWSGSAYEFSLVTLKPAVFVDTPPKINNPDYSKLNVEPLEFKLRDQVGIRVDPANLSGLDRKIDALFANSDVYADRILQIRNRYIAHFGQSGEIGGKYILEQLLERQRRAKETRDNKTFVKEG